MTRSHSKRIRDFALAYWNNWFAIMSGGPSVPLAIATYFIQSDTAKTWLWATSGACIILSSFFVWRAEHERAEELETRANPVAAMNAQTEAIRAQTAALRNQANRDRTDQHPMILAFR